MLLFRGQERRGKKHAGGKSGFDRFAWSGNALLASPHSATQQRSADGIAGVAAEISNAPPSGRLGLHELLEVAVMECRRHWTTCAHPILSVCGTLRSFAMGQGAHSGLFSFRPCRNSCVLGATGYRDKSRRGKFRGVGQAESWVSLRC